MNKCRYRNCLNSTFLPLTIFRWVKLSLFSLERFYQNKKKSLWKRRKVIKLNLFPLLIFLSLGSFVKRIKENNKKSETLKIHTDIIRNHVKIKKWTIKRKSKKLFYIFLTIYKEKLEIKRKFCDENSPNHSC